MSRYGLGNYGHYRGETLQERVRGFWSQEQLRFRRLAEELIRLIGAEAYDAWIAEVWPDGLEMTWTEACELIDHKLDLYECAGDPPDGMCGGCLRRAEAVRQSQYVTDGAQA